jgi:hypothetical protein
MAAVVANKVKRERQLRESKASFDASQQQLHQRNGAKGHTLSQQEAQEHKAKMMYYKKV